MAQKPLHDRTPRRDSKDKNCSGYCNARLPLDGDTRCQSCRNRRQNVGPYQRRISFYSPRVATTRPPTPPRRLSPAASAASSLAREFEICFKCTTFESNAKEKLRPYANIFYLLTNYLQQLILAQVFLFFSKAVLNGCVCVSFEKFRATWETQHAKSFVQSLPPELPTCYKKLPS